MEEKRCKKCGRILPQDCKSNICEHCLQGRIDKFKEVGLWAVSGLLTVGSGALALFWGSENKSIKK